MTPETGRDELELRLTLFPAVHLAAAIFGAALLVLGLGLLVFSPTDGGDGWGAALTATLFGGVIGGLSILILRRRWGTLIIASGIAYHRREIHLELPREAARQVNIARPGRRLVNPTTYSLQVDVKGKRFNLPFAEHWWSGARASRRAEQVSRVLGIPISDPIGERERASRLTPVRWMGRGEEWKFLPLVVGIAVVVAIVVEMLWP